MEESFESIPYAEWLEDSLRELMQHKVKSMGLVALIDEGEVLTAYYMAGLADKALMATHINVDSLMDAVLANAGLIVATAEAEDEQDD